MTKHRPDLFIDTTPVTDQMIQDNFYLEIDKYSITPTTFKSRQLVSKIYKENVSSQFHKTINTIKQKIQSTKNLLETSDSLSTKAEKEKIITTSESQELKAKNPLPSLLNAKLSELENQQNKLGVYKKTIQYIDNTMVYKDTYSNSNGGSVMRYALNSSKLNKLAEEHNSEWAKLKLNNTDGSGATSKKSGRTNKYESSDKALLPIEICLIQKAIISLVASQAKTALIDIFEKSDNGLINYNKTTKCPETHTVVLYKNDNTTFSVIDPTDSSFSTHIASNMNNMLINEVVALSAPTKNIKIYIPEKGNTGNNSTDYRDCIDIAVKLAFGLQKITGHIDVSKLGELEFIKEITNQQKINESFIKEYGIARIRQASNDEFREKFQKIMAATDKQLMSIVKYPNSEKLLLSIEKKKSGVFNKQYSPDLYKDGIIDLFNFYKENSSEFQEMILGETKTLETEVI
jgi:hypothetical protein